MPQTQDRAIAPAPAGRRKVVLATSIAETSLTIEGVRIVIDCGLARVPRYEPDVGPDAAGNRARLARRRRPAPRPRRPHRARRLLSAVGRAADRLARAYARPEILAADLSGLLLDLRAWGAADPGQLAFLDPPPAGALTEARALLAELGAHRRRGPHHRRGQEASRACRCRRGSPAWWSMRPREGAGQRSPPISPRS